MEDNLDAEIAEMLREVIDDTRVLADTQSSSGVLLMDANNNVDFDEWTKYVNQMLNLITVQTGKLAILTGLLTQRSQP